MPEVWFTGDTHFGHKAILRPDYSARPFPDVDAMDDALIKNWREAVGPHDRVYHLGDFSFRNKQRTFEILDQLPGHIFLIRGNHDQAIKGSLAGRFQWVKDYHELKIDGQRLVLAHYPMASWNKAHRGAIMLHGHCHGNLKGGETLPRVDVGVDCWNYGLINMNLIKFAVEGKHFTGVDHHEPRGEYAKQPCEKCEGKGYLRFTDVDGTECTACHGTGAA